MRRMERSSLERSSRTESARKLALGSMAMVASHLQQVILDHVAQRAGFLVIRAAALHADGFRRGDLHVVHVAAVPQRLEDAVAEAEGQDVLHGLLAEVVIDAVDLGFVEALCSSLLSVLRAVQIVPERLFDHHAAPAHALADVRLAPRPCAMGMYWLGCVER